MFTRKNRLGQVYRLYGLTPEDIGVVEATEQNLKSSMWFWRFILALDAEKCLSDTPAKCQVWQAKRVIEDRN